MDSVSMAIVELFMTIVRIGKSERTAVSEIKAGHPKSRVAHEVDGELLRGGKFRAQYQP